MPKPETKHRNQLGRLGESAAVEYLLNKGYRIIERNYRCRSGELDIIGEIDEYLVFVEVKSRYLSKQMISPFISITKNKRNKLRHLGQSYLIRKNIRSKQPRFDVIGVVFKDEKNFTVEHIENAF